jgi:hypothetical protein
VGDSRQVSLSPDVHVGGGVARHCIPKAPWLLVHGAPGLNPARLMLVTRSINDEMPLHVADLVRAGLVVADRYGACYLVLDSWRPRTTGNLYPGKASHPRLVLRCEVEQWQV